MNRLTSFVEKVLEDYASQLDTAYPNLTEGIYITGSAALGDYYSRKSDIDFIAVLREIPTAEMVRRFKHIHLNIEKAYGHPKLNGYYLTTEGLSSGQKSAPSFFMNQMHFERPFELDKVTLLELKNHAYTVKGIPAAELPLQVELANVAAQMHQNINSYWVSWITKYSPICRNYMSLVLFPRLTEWGILGVARQLYTIETGKIASKLDAGIYCLEKLPSELRNVLRTAIDTRRINKTQLKPSYKRANETLDCMKFIIAEFNGVYNNTRVKS